VGAPAEGGGVGGVASGDEGAVPNGVRVVLSLASGPTLRGNVVRDWVRPTLQAGRP
jgi:general secretion pathway protein J